MQLALPEPQVSLEPRDLPAQQDSLEPQDSLVRLEPQALPVQLALLEQPDSLEPQASLELRGSLEQQDSLELRDPQENEVKRGRLEVSCCIWTRREEPTPELPSRERSVGHLHPERRQRSPSSKATQPCSQRPSSAILDPCRAHILMMDFG